MTNSQTLPSVLNIYKEVGKTPLQMLDRLREVKPEFKDAILSYVGRLDPMADGVMVVLVNDENKKREQYLGADKEYTAEILWGVSTDTGDMLGLITDVNFPPYIDEQKISEAASQQKGDRELSYPAYSSKPVNGKPLFQWAREGRLAEIKIPTKKVHIYNCEVVKNKTQQWPETFSVIKNNIEKVSGDFRQKEIFVVWCEIKTQKTFLTEIKISCSSGTYIRSIIQEIGRDIGVPVCAYRITRTQQGAHHTIDQSLHLF